MAQTPILGAIFMFAGNFAPQGYQLCNGQLLPISQYTALFSILGTTYGGNGTTNFALPDLRSRVPLHWGQGSGLSPYVLGEQLGVESVALTAGQMPIHNHQVNASTAAGTATTPASNFLSSLAVSGGNLTSSHVPPEFPGLAVSPAAANLYGSSAPITQMNPQMLATAGGNQVHENRQPALCISFIIAMEGIFPTRN